MLVKPVYMTCHKMLTQRLSDSMHPFGRQKCHQPPLFMSMHRTIAHLHFVLHWESEEWILLSFCLSSQVRVKHCTRYLHTVLWQYLATKRIDWKEMKYRDLLIRMKSQVQQGNWLSLTFFSHSCKSDPIINYKQSDGMRPLTDETNLLQKVVSGGDSDQILSHK